MYLTLSRKLIILGLSATLVPLVAILIGSYYKADQVNTLVTEALEKDARHSLEGRVEALVEEAELADTLLHQNILGTLATAEEVLDRTGGIQVDTSTNVEWKAIDQITGATTQVRLPRLLAGDRWLGQVSRFDGDVVVPVVDAVTERTGNAATVFQRMNAQGDMLRAATTVRDANGNRAIGTYIPHDSVVVQTVLRGETFVGRAFVVDKYYITAYQPIQDASAMSLA